MKPRAFVLEPTRHDSTKARRHGEVVLLFHSHSAHPPLFSPGFQNAVAARLRDLGFDPEHDFVVLTGSLLEVALFAAVVAAQYGPFESLMFDARDDVREYRVVPAGAVEPVLSH